MRDPAFRNERVNGTETVWLEGRTGRRMICGIASTPTINAHKYSLSSEGCVARLPIPVLSQHEGDGKPIGEVVRLRKSRRHVYVEAIIFEGNVAADHAWRLIEAGELRALSGAMSNDPRTHRLQGIADGVSFYDQWMLKEVSICREGANPDCRFEILYSREP